MAAGTVIGSLRVVLGADTAAFESGLQKANQELGSFAKGAVAFGNAAAIAIGAAAAAITASVGHALKQADEIGKASQKFGVPVESLSALKYAADLADVSFESLGKGLGKLSKAMLEGVVNPAGEAAKTFAALGISVKDSAGNLRSTEAVFGDIAGKFAGMEDGAAKTALAIRVFGKAGAELIPLLNAGKTGIAAMTEEAAKLGLIISADTAAKAEQFNDTMKKVFLTLNAIGMRIAEELLPHLQKLADSLLGVAQEGSAFNSIIKNLITEEDIREIQLFTQYWENLVRIITTLKGISVGEIISGAAFDKLGAAIETNKTKIDALKGAQKQLAETGITAATEMDNLGYSTGRAAKGLGDVNLGALAAKNSIVQFTDATHITAEAYKEIDGLIEGSLPEWEKLKEKIFDIQMLMEGYPERAEELKRALLQTQQSLQNLMLTATATALGQFGDLFTALGQRNKKLFEIGKAFAIAEAIVNTYKAANMALAQPPGPPISYAYVAAAIAAGLANVIKIQSTKPPAMAIGGAMQIAGSGGIDSKMVSFMGSPGETVRVDQNKYGEGGGGRTITLAGVKAKDYYRGDVLRDFVDNLNEAIGDGLKIKLA